MRTYLIIDEVHSTKMGTIQAINGKSALKKFLKQRVTSTGMWEIYQLPTGWTLSSSFGASYYASEIHEYDTSKMALSN